MKSAFQLFFRNLVVFSAVLGLVILILFLILPRHYFTPSLPFSFFFFFLVTLAGYYILIRATQKRFIRFLNVYLLTTVIKLIVFIGVLVLYMMLNQKDAVPFALWFFLLYLGFTFFEVYYLISYSKTLQK